MKQSINEIKRLQELAGISESVSINEYDSDDVEKLKELKELFQKVIDFNKDLGALPINTLNKLMKELDDNIEDAPRLTVNKKNYD